MEAQAHTPSLLQQGAKPIAKNALTPLNFDDLDSAQQKWLKDLGLHNDKSILDFNCTKETITFLIDGEAVERQRCQIWTRVMGYHRPVASFNTGKQGEFAERVNFCTAKTEAQLRKEPT